MKVDARKLYENIKHKRIKYDEDKHCELIIAIMADDEQSRVSSFCAQVGIGMGTFYNWLKENETFKLCYELGKTLSRENWEAEGKEIRELITMPGTMSYKFEYWRMMGWSRFGIGKTLKVKLDLDPDAKPTEHYSQLIKQANDGEFTASEIKQLMESLALGLKTQQTVEMQEQIDQLTEDLAVMRENSSGNNNFTDKTIKKKD